VNPRLVAPVENSPSPVDMLFTEADDDRPFTYIAESSAAPPPTPPPAPAQPVGAEPREWWQDSAKSRSIGRSGNIRAVTGSDALAPESAPDSNRPAASVNGTSITPSTMRKTTTGQRSDLPSWLMDQPTQFELRALRPSSLTGSERVAAAPVSKPSLAEWQSEEPARSVGSTEPVASAISLPASTNGNGKTPHQAVGAPAKTSNVAEWQTPQKTNVDVSQQSDDPASMLQSLVMPRHTDELSRRETNKPEMPGSAVATPPPIFVPDKLVAPSSQVERPPTIRQQSTARRNYSVIVSALQTLGYTLPGFIASAVVGMDGQPIAQVAMEDQDISAMCGDFSIILKSAMLVLQQGSWGQHEDTIITSATHHVLLRVLDREREVFQVLITTRESDPVESLEVMATVESAIVAAL
jgi:predicted regulator of Ras-like GTPase activity (Roadblock/LC7/MglB family)